MKENFEINKETVDDLLINGTLLLNLPEFDKFNFDIDLDNPCYTKISAIFKERLDKSKLYEKAIPLARDILKEVFTAGKKKKMLAVLDEIQSKHHDNKDIYVIARVSRLFLETQDSSRLPLAIEKLIKDAGAAVDRERAQTLSKAHELIAAGNIEGAKQIFAKIKQDDPEHWDGPVGLAQIFRQSGDNEKARGETMNALRLVHKFWQNQPRYLRYETVEAIEQMADIVLSRTQEETNSRLLNYVYGFLFEVGAASFEEIFDFLYSIDIIAMCPFIDKESLRRAMAKDGRFKTNGTHLYLPAVKDIDLLLSERKRRSIDTLLRPGLSEVELCHEARFEVMFCSREKEIDAALRKLTDKKWCLISAGWLMRGDIKGSTGLDGLVSSVAGMPQSREIMNLLSELWQNTFRWDLGGRSPFDFKFYALENGLSEKRLAPKNPFSSKPHEDGRKNPCPRAGGKKHKKCRG